MSRNNGREKNRKPRRQNLKLLRQTPNGVLFPDLCENPWVMRLGGRETSHSTAALNTVELCAGAGGQALGFEKAGIDHTCLVEIDKYACQTLRLNRPAWNVQEQDLNQFNGTPFKGVEIISGGLPCPPFSIVELVQPSLMARHKECHWRESKALGLPPASAAG